MFVKWHKDKSYHDLELRVDNLLVGTVFLYGGQWGWRDRKWSTVEWGYQFKHQAIDGLMNFLTA